MRRISTATGSSAGAAVTSPGGGTLYAALARGRDFSVDRAHSGTATTDATTPRIQKTAETRPTTSPTASLSGHGGDQHEHQGGEHAPSIEGLA